MNNFLSLQYWLNPRPGSLSPALFQGVIIFLVLLFASFIILQFLKKHNNRLYYKTFDKLSTFTFVNFFAGLMLSFFSFELIPVLSSRFWFLLWTLEMIVWLFYVLKEFRKIPGKRRKLEEKHEFQKYVP